MRTFNDILGEGFEEHARALPAGGGLSGGGTRSVLRSIRRRRAARVVATAGGSALAVGAVTVGAMALRPSGVAQPGVTPGITNGLYPWCDLSTYPVLNPNALGAMTYKGRVYADLANQVYVYAAPDGTHRTLELDADGVARFSTADGGTEIFEVAPDLREAWLQGPDAHEDMYLDLILSGGGGGFDPEGPDGPGLGYEWTTVVPEVVPAGVNVGGLSEVHAVSLGFPGTGYDPTLVPQGAIVETVLRWHDGRQLAIEVVQDGPGAEVPDFTDLASVSLRVSNLPDGGVFEITSTYDPSRTWQVACWPYRDDASPTASPAVGPTPTPSWGVTPSPSPSVSQGGFGVGPTPTPSYVTPAPSPSPSAALSSASPAPTT